MIIERTHTGEVLSIEAWPERVLLEPTGDGGALLLHLGDHIFEIRTTSMWELVVRQIQ